MGVRVIEKRISLGKSPRIRSTSTSNLIAFGARFGISYTKIAQRMKSKYMSIGGAPSLAKLPTRHRS